MSAPTVIEYILSRLNDLGIQDIFGVPGDYSFPLNDAICNHPDIRWIGCCNELNAAYAADGYARVRGVGAVCSTYGVGELSAINGIAGAYAEHLPIFHLVGTPNMRTQGMRMPMHHTFGNGDYDMFRRMTEPVVCAHAVITPQNAVFETERLIHQALYHRRPVYMALPADYAVQPIIGIAEPLPLPGSNPKNLQEAVEAIAQALDVAAQACILPGILVARTGQQQTMKTLIEASGLPFATMFMGKSVVDEQLTNYIGMYDGRLMNEDVRAFVESSDVVIMAGTLLSDFNTGAFTANLQQATIINISHHHTSVGNKLYDSIEINDILQALSIRLLKRALPKMFSVASLGNAIGKGADAISADALYPRWGNFLLPGDILVAETGTASMGLGFAHLPKGASFYNQTLWGSIGWATPASFGAAIADPGRRMILVTGDGAHQLTVQEISQFQRYGARVIIFVLNNAGYLIERLLCSEPSIEYNDVAAWRYADLPSALGCIDWFSARVTTCEELDAALDTAANSTNSCYIEVVTDAYAASPLSMKLHETFRRLYKT